MKLNERLLNSFEYNGKTYAINLSFDKVLDFQDIHGHDELDIEYRIPLMLYALDVECEESEQAFVVDYILKNVLQLGNGADEEEAYDLLGNPLPKAPRQYKEPTVDFVEDAELIYASFRQAYGINLSKELGRLHWYEFIALLNGLPDGTIMHQVRSIREWTPSKHDSSEYKKQMRKLQKAWSLKGKQRKGE